MNFSSGKICVHHSKILYVHTQKRKRIAVTIRMSLLFYMMSLRVIFPVTVWNPSHGIMAVMYV